MPHQNTYHPSSTSSTTYNRPHLSSIDSISSNTTLGSLTSFASPIKDTPNNRHVEQQSFINRTINANDFKASDSLVPQHRRRGSTNHMRDNAMSRTSFSKSPLRAIKSGSSQSSSPSNYSHASSAQTLQSQPQPPQVAINTRLHLHPTQPSTYLQTPSSKNFSSEMITDAEGSQSKAKLGWTKIKKSVLVVTPISPIIALNPGSPKKQIGRNLLEFETMSRIRNFRDAAWAVVEENKRKIKNTDSADSATSTVDVGKAKRKPLHLSGASLSDDDAEDDKSITTYASLCGSHNFPDPDLASLSNAGIKGLLNLDDGSGKSMKDMYPTVTSYNNRNVFPEWILDSGEWKGLRSVIKKRELLKAFETNNNLRDAPQIELIREWLTLNWDMARHLGVRRCVALAKAVQYTEGKKGETIITEGERGYTFYIVIDGEVSIFKEGYGKIAVLGKGKFFGERALTSNQYDLRQATVISESGVCKLLVLHKSEYDGIIRSYQESIRTEAYRVLKGVPLFNHWSRSRLERVCSLLERREVKAGVRIFRQGDLPDHIYFIVDGIVEVIKEITVSTKNRWPASGGGWEEKVRKFVNKFKILELHPGKYFGEIAIVNNTVRAATCETQTPCVLLALDKFEFLNLLNKGHSMQNIYSQTQGYPSDEDILHLFTALDVKKPPLPKGAVFKNSSKDSGSGKSGKNGKKKVIEDMNKSLPRIDSKESMYSPSDPLNQFNQTTSKLSTIPTELASSTALNNARKMKRLTNIGGSTSKMHRDSMDTQTKAGELLRSKQLARQGSIRSHAGMGEAGEGGEGGGRKPLKRMASYYEF